VVSPAAVHIVAMVSLAFYRVFQSLVSGQAKLFEKSGNELELAYRKDWSERGGSRLNKTSGNSNALLAVDAKTETTDTPEHQP